MNQFVGPPLGGFLAAVAIATAFGTGAVAYGLAAASLLAIPGAFRAVREGPARRIDQDAGRHGRNLQPR